MKKSLLVLVLIFFLIVIAANLVYLFYFVKQTEVKKMYLEVADQRTISSEDVIFFGYGYTGSVQDRTSNVYMTNNYDYPLLVSVKIIGNISEFVSVSENDFILAEGEKRILMYKATLPKDLGKGIYSGETRVVFTRALKLT
jgi:hypothetical protein